MTRTMTKCRLLLITIFAMLFFSCEKENLIETPVLNKYVIKNFKFSELKNRSGSTNIDGLISQGINLIKEKEPKNRGGNNSFTIDSTTIKEITFGNYKTYTMLVKRTEQTKDYFENLIIEIDSLNNKSVFITKYFPDQKIEYLPEHDTHTFHGETQTFKSEFPTTLFGNTNDFDPNQPVGDSGSWLNCVWILKCDWHGTHNAGPGCSVTYLVRECATQNGTPVSTSPVYAPSWGPSGINSSNGGTSGVGGVNTNTNVTTPNQTPVTPPITSIVTPPVTDSELNAENIIANEFYYPLSKEKKLFVHNKLGLYQSLVEYLSLNITNNTVNAEALLFANEVVNVSIQLNINAMSVWEDYDNFVGQMSINEKNIFDNLLPNRKLWYMASAKKALDKTMELFPVSSHHNGKGDAFRHALWNGLCKLTMAGNLGEQLTTAHEDKPAPPGDLYNYKEKQMDLYNNNKGIQIALISNLTNITANVLLDLNNGYLVYLNNLDTNKRATYNSVLIPTNQ